MMSRIVYVCLSDLHLGKEDSLLTNLAESESEIDPSASSPVMTHLAECLRAVLQETLKSGQPKPSLILNGDVLELALCETHKAGMVFQRFMELVIPKEDSLFDKIFVIPGNHDHHLWEMGREHQYTEYLKRHPDVTPLPAPWHTTKLLSLTDPYPTAYFLTELIQRSEKLSKVPVRVAYPSLGLPNADNSKMIVFNHGHFTEWVYSLMSVLKEWFLRGSQASRDVLRGLQAWEVEMENFAWIDFVWSALGRSGEVDEDLETIYEKIGDREATSELAANLVAAGVGASTGWKLPSWLEDVVLERLLRWVASPLIETERSKPDCPLSADGKKTLYSYIEGPLRNHIAYAIIAEQNGEKSGPQRKPTPEEIANVKMPELTFIFGHTHKPYSAYEDFGGFSKWVDVYNTGGWIVEALESQPCHGAAMVLIDENLNAASIRMYNESEHEEDYAVSVEEVPRGFRPRNDFYDRIRALVDAKSDPWKTFSETVATAVTIRRKHLQARVHRRLPS